MARRIDRWRMYLLFLAADMRDAGVIDEARYRRIVGRLDEVDARDVVRVVETVFTESHGESPGIHSGDEADCTFGLHMVEYRHGGSQV